MKVFISWSGEKSKAVAKALRRWIPDIIQSVQPWMSEADIYAGSRWANEIGKELSETTFGIICLTRSNITSPWILFEAGALAKSLSDTFVCPYLVDLDIGDIPGGPLTQFQSKRADEKGTLELLFSVNAALKNEALDKERLRRLFERSWQDLKGILGHLPDEEEGKPRRTTDDKVDEILQIVRELSRSDLHTWKDLSEMLTGFTKDHWARAVHKTMLETQHDSKPRQIFPIFDVKDKEE
jgi:hypothetical protein